MNNTKLFRLLLVLFTITAISLQAQQTVNTVRRYKLLEVNGFEVWKRVSPVKTALRGRHVIPHDITFELIDKAKGRNEFSWQFQTTGSGGDPLWVFKDGTLIMANYDRLTLLKSKKKEKIYYQYATSDLCTYVPGQSYETIPLLANDEGLFVQKRSSSLPELIYFHHWDAILKGNWEEGQLASGTTGANKMSSAHHISGNILLNEGKFFSLNRNTLSIFDLTTKEVESIKLENYLSENALYAISLVHYHEDELVFWANNVHYGFDLKSRNVSRLNLNKQALYDRSLPRYPMNYDPPNGLHIVTRNETGAIFQNKDGILFFYDWKEKEHSVDYSSCQTLTDKKGIEYQAAGKLLSRICWKNERVASLRGSTLMIYNLKRKSLATFSLPIADTTTIYAIINLHKNQVLLSTSLGSLCYDTATGQLYNPHIYKEQ